MSVRLIEIEPGRWRVQRRITPPASSDLPRPYVISDTMDPVEQVDGRFYTSKSKFRAAGRSLGLIEVGNEKLPPKQRSTDLKHVKESRDNSIRKAVAQYRSGVRVK